jgi:anti-sigma factor RsiW
MGWKREAARTDELLSAYLDGALSPEERARLEARLAVDADLRDRLEAMRRTVALVRGLPRVEAPRNFLLTPDMVAPATRRRPALLQRRLAPVLTFATALSALACALVVIGNLLTLGVGGFGAAPAAAPPREVAMEPATEEAETELLPQSVPEETRVAMEGIVTETLEITKTVAPEAAMAPEEEAPLTLAPAAVPTALPTPVVTAGEEAAKSGATAAPTPSPAPVEGGALPPPTPPPPQPGWPLLALGLALLTLGLLVATVWAWRARV